MDKSTTNNLRAPTLRQVALATWGQAQLHTTVPATITLYADALGTTGPNFRRPFSAVHFYRIEDLSGHVYYLGQATAAAVTFPGGTQAQYMWEFTWSAVNDTNVRAGTHTFFAVGVDFDGDARRTDGTVNHVIYGAYQQQR
jgi:hypothetical protein